MEGALTELALNPVLTRVLTALLQNLFVEFQSDILNVLAFWSSTPLSEKISLRAKNA